MRPAAYANYKNQGVTVNPRVVARGLSAAALLCCVSLVDAGINSWTITGPDVGWAETIAVHPTNSQIALLGSRRGLYRSTDAGAHWSLVNSSVTDSVSVKFDRSDPNRVFAVSRDLWISDDAGQSFAAVLTPVQTSVEALRLVELSPAGTIYIATFSGKVFRSTTHGNTWTSCATPWGAAIAVDSLYVDPNPNPSDHLFLSVDTSAGNANNGTWRSVDDCTSWTQSGSGNPAGSAGPDTQVYRYAVMPGNPSRVFAGTDQGLKLSINGGATWTLTSPITTYWVEWDPFVPGRVLLLSGPGMVGRSNDGGDNWNFLFGAPVRTPAAAQLVLDPLVPNRMFMATYNGAYISVDGGINFTPRNLGLRAADAIDLSVADDGTLYAVFNPGAGGVFRRDPATGNWGPVNNDALAVAAVQNSFNMSHVATAPTDSSLLYVGIHNASLARSNDGGATWSNAHPTLLNAGVSLSDTKIDPDNALVAYSATMNKGMWKTANGGTTWAQVNNGLPLAARFVTPAPGSDTVYAIAGDPATPYPGEIYKSTDGGATWNDTSVPVLPAFGGVYQSITVDPSDTNVVYVGYSGGILRSTNGGGSWTKMTFTGLPAGTTYAGGTSVLLDPEFSTTIIATPATANSSAARTVDGGAHWEEIKMESSGPFGPVIGQAVLNPLRPNMIIATVLGSNLGEYEIATDLSLSVTGLTAALGTSTSVDAALVVKNLGPHAASPSDLTVTLPAWLTPTVPAECTRTGQTLDCHLPALQVDGTYNLSLPLSVSATGGTGQFAATLSGHETEIDSNNNAYSLSVTGSELADLALTLTPGSTSIDHAAATTLTAAVLNRGPSPSSLTTLVLQIPAGLAVQNVATSRGTCTQGAGTVDCALGTLAANATASVTLQLLGAAPGLAVINGHLDGAGTDSGSDQDASQSITVRAVGDLSVELAESVDPVQVATSFTYTATVKNLSGDAAGAHLSVPITGARVSAATASAGTCTTTTAQVDCDIASLAAGANATVTITLDAQAAGIATANATLTHAGTETDPANNTASIGTTLRLVGDLAVELANSADPVFIGNALSYTATVRNLGPNAGSAHLQVTFVGGTTGAPAPGAGGTCTTAPSLTQVDCDFASVATGAAATVTIPLTTTAAGTATATAQATFGGTDPVLTNNSATASTAINTQPSSSSSGGGAGGGGGGGGGRFDWLAAGLLGLLLLRRRPGARAH
jgi:uncharacterized protein DUF11